MSLSRHLPDEPKNFNPTSKNVLMVGGKGYEMEYDQSQLHLANSSKGA